MEGLNQLRAFDQKHAQELLDKGLTSCEMRCERDVELIWRGVERLIHLPPEERDKWDGREQHDGQSDLGLSRRDREGEEEEHKWYFHYNPRLLKALIANGADFAPFGEFLKACHRVYHQSMALGDQLSETYGLPHADSDGKLRLVWYDKVEAPGTVALGHWDRNTFTFHIAESHGGLMAQALLDYAVEAPPMRMLERACKDLVHLFASAKAVLADPTRFKPIFHEGIMVESEVNRWALVFFYHHTMEWDVPRPFHAKVWDTLASVVRNARAA